MIKQYPMRVEENLWREAKAKAALEGVTLRAAIEELLCIWVEGKICIDKKAIKE